MFLELYFWAAQKKDVHFKFFLEFFKMIFVAKIKSNMLKSNWTIHVFRSIFLF